MMTNMDLALMHSEQISEITAALIEVQRMVKPVLKDKDNPFFKSKYADLGAVYDACRPELLKNGIVPIQAPWIVNGEPALTTILAHKSGQWFRGVMLLSAAKDPKQGIVTPQNQGSALTYARRYSICAMAGIITDDDDDGNAASGRGEYESAPSPGRQPKGQAQPAQGAPYRLAIPTAPAPITMPVNPATGEIGPEEVRAWCKAFCTAIKKAKNAADLEEWIAQNAQNWGEVAGLPARVKTPDVKGIYETLVRFTDAERAKHGLGKAAQTAADVDPADYLMAG